MDRVLRGCNTSVFAIEFEHSSAIRLWRFMTKWRAGGNIASSRLTRHPFRAKNYQSQMPI